MSEPISLDLAETRRTLLDLAHRRFGAIDPERLGKNSAVFSSLFDGTTDAVVFDGR